VNIGSIGLTGSLGTRLWTWAQWLDKIGGRADEAFFELQLKEGRKWCIAEPKMIGWLKGLLMCMEASIALHIKV
jgi:hypothetical protein